MIQWQRLASQLHGLVSYEQVFNNFGWILLRLASSFTTAWTKQCSLGWVVEAGFTTAWTKLKLRGLLMNRCSIMGGLVKVSFTTAWTKQCSQLHGLNLNCMD